MPRIAPQNDNSSWLFRLSRFLQNGPLRKRGSLCDNFISQLTSDFQSKLERRLATRFT